jgi:hypothetical protein
VEGNEGVDEGEAGEINESRQTPADAASEKEPPNGGGEETHHADTTAGAHNQDEEGSTAEAAETVGTRLSERRNEEGVEDGMDSEMSTMQDDERNALGEPERTNLPGNRRLSETQPGKRAA